MNEGDPKTENLRSQVESWISTEREKGKRIFVETHAGPTGDLTYMRLLRMGIKDVSVIAVDRVMRKDNQVGRANFDIKGELGNVKESLVNQDIDGMIAFNPNVSILKNKETLTAIHDILKDGQDLIVVDASTGDREFKGIYGKVRQDIDAMGLNLELITEDVRSQNEFAGVLYDAERTFGLTTREPALFLLRKKDRERP